MNGGMHPAASWGAAQFGPMPNVGPMAEGGPQQPADLYTRPSAQQGATGPTVPAPGQAAYSQPRSPNYGAASSTGAQVVFRWGGAQFGGYWYALYNDGAVVITATPTQKSTSTRITKASNAAGYQAILNEYVKVYPKSAYVGYVKALLGTASAAESMQAQVAQALSYVPASLPTAFQPSVASAPPASTALTAPASTSSSPGGWLPSWPWLVGGAVAFTVIAGGAYWLMKPARKAS